MTGIDNNSVAVRLMLPNEWPLVSHITRNEGWTNDDDEFLEFIITKQPGVRSLVAVDSIDKPIGLLNWVQLTPSYAYVGLYVVQRDQQAGAMTAKYRERSGFHIASPIKSIRYKIDACSLRKYLENQQLPHLQFVDLKEANVDEAVEWHSNKAGGCVGVEFWLDLTQMIFLSYSAFYSTVGVFACDSNSGQSLGFGCLIPFYKGFRFSPLYATNFDVAKALMLELIKRRPTAPFFYISVPSCNSKMLEFVAEFDTELVHQLDRSFTIRDETKYPFPDIIYSIGNQ